jgi:hypothetical protein
MIAGNSVHRAGGDGSMPAAGVTVYFGRARLLPRPGGFCGYIAKRGAAGASPSQLGHNDG